MSLATFLQLALLVQLAAGAALGAWFLPDAVSRWWLLVVAIAVPVIGTALVLAIEFIAGAIVDPRSPRTSLLHVARVWLGETSASLRVFCLRQPFAAGFAEPNLVADPQRPAVLLVHGYACNRAVWKPLLASGLLADCNVATVNLTPVFGPIGHYADVLHAAIERLRAATGATRVMIVGHSMGGLVARAYLRKRGDAAVARVITIATPHAGTIFGGFGHGRNARQMAHSSAFMRELASALTPAVLAKFVCVATADDNLVVPRSSPLLEGTKHIVLDGIGHLAMLEDRRVWDVLVRELCPYRELPSSCSNASTAARN